VGACWDHPSTWLSRKLEEIISMGYQNEGCGDLGMNSYGFEGYNIAICGLIECRDAGRIYDSFTTQHLHDRFKSDVGWNIFLLMYYYPTYVLIRC